MGYTANDIRNICLLGHGGSGKTTLAEQMLFMTKGTDRLGRTADGNTVCDYDAEEIKRQISISLAFAPVRYKDVRINVMDAPGNFDFSGEAVSAIRAAECAVLVGAAKDGLSVGMERSWKLLGTRDITVPDGVTGYRGVSLTRDFLQSGSSNPDFEPLNTLQEDTAYEYAISFTKVAGIADPAPRKGVWSQRVNLKVYVAAGSNNDLGFLNADLTEENWAEALDGGVTNIGLPSDFSLRKQFTDNEAPSFIGGYPEFTPGDSTVEMRLMLDRLAFHAYNYINA